MKYNKVRLSKLGKLKDFFSIEYKEPNKWNRIQGLSLSNDTNSFHFHCSQCGLELRELRQKRINLTDDSLEVGLNDEIRERVTKSESIKKKKFIVIEQNNYCFVQKNI